MTHWPYFLRFSTLLYMLEFYASANVQRCPDSGHLCVMPLCLEHFPLTFTRSLFKYHFISKSSSYGSIWKGVSTSLVLGFMPCSSGVIFILVFTLCKVRNQYRILSKAIMWHNLHMLESHSFGCCSKINCERWDYQKLWWWYVAGK